MAPNLLLLTPTPLVPGGANVPALNELLQPYGIAFGDAIIHGTTTIAGVSVQVWIGGGGEKEDLKFGVWK